MKEKTNNILKTSFIILSVLLVTPSIIYLLTTKTVKYMNIYYNFFIIRYEKIVTTIIYLILFIAISVIYFIIIKRKNIFESPKKTIIFITIISAIFTVMLPWTSSDIFYYMGVGELDSVYKQNPYYISMRQYYNENKENINDDILEKGAKGYWGNTTAVYGPIAALIFKICAKISFKNINFCLIVFKLVNLAIHIFCCFLIYKITKKTKFVKLYGLNPFILIEFLGNVHNDIIVVCLILLSIYFLLKKKNILLSVLILAVATGIKYFTILLLPAIVLYHFRNEKSILKRLVKCIQYGIIFLGLVMLEYILYYKDPSIFTAMMAQTGKQCKSIYSSIFCINKEYSIILNKIVTVIFIYTYIQFCINLLLNKNIKFYKIIRKYNNILIIFLISLSNFQQWYIIWTFATIMWQKPNMIRNIIGVAIASEIANSIYMFKNEHFRYDVYFVGIITILLLISQISKKVLKSKNKEKGELNFE